MTNTTLKKFSKFDKIMKKDVRVFILSLFAISLPFIFADDLKEVTTMISSNIATTSSEEPIKSSEEPTTSSEEPIKSSEEPTTSSEEPTTSSEEPTTSSEEPITSSEEPIKSSEEPTTSSEEPIIFFANQNQTNKSTEQNIQDIPNFAKSFILNLLK